MVWAHRLIWAVVDPTGGLGYWRNAWATLLEGLCAHEHEANIGGASVDFYGLSGLAISGEITLM
jgi:hypothetical protein